MVKNNEKIRDKNLQYKINKKAKLINVIVLKVKKHYLLIKD